MRRLRRGQGRLCRGRSLVSWYLDARAGPPGQRTAHGGRSCRDRAQQPDRAAGRGPADRAAGRQGAVHLGLMGGYGSARSTSTSSLALPGGATAQARARGKVSGYSAGVYGTYYQDDASRMGAYADGWLQYGRFNNRIDSELGRRAMTPRCGAPRPKPAMRSSLSPSARRWGRSLSSRTSSWSTATTMRRMPCCRGPAWAKATPAPGTRMPACACIPRPLRARRRCVRSWNWIGCTASIRRPCGWGPTRWPPRPRATAWN